MNACIICGGTAGSFSPDGAHYLCEARRAQGQPTPSLGDRCPVCNGTKVKPGRQGGVMLFLDLGPEAIRRSIEAQFPPCEACDGSGVKP